MTKEDLAKAYHERIIERNPQAEAWDLSGAFIAGYDAGYDEAKDEFDRDLEEATMTIRALHKYYQQGFCKVCRFRRKGCVQSSCVHYQEFLNAVL